MAESIDSIIKKFKISNDNLPQNLKGIDENIYKNNLQTIIKKKMMIYIVILYNLLLLVHLFKLLHLVNLFNLLLF